MTREEELDRRTELWRKFEAQQIGWASKGRRALTKASKVDELPPWLAEHLAAPMEIGGILREVVMTWGEPSPSAGGTGGGGTGDGGTGDGVERVRLRSGRR